MPGGVHDALTPRNRTVSLSIIELCRFHATVCQSIVLYDTFVDIALMLVTLCLHSTAGCTTGWVNYANEPSQASIERNFSSNFLKRIIINLFIFLPSVAYDPEGRQKLHRSQKATKTLLYLFIYYMNIQKVSSSRLYNNGLWSNHHIACAAAVQTHTCMYPRANDDGAPLYTDDKIELIRCSSVSSLHCLPSSHRFWGCRLYAFVRLCRLPSVLTFCSHPDAVWCIHMQLFFGL